MSDTMTDTIPIIVERSTGANDGPRPNGAKPDGKPCRNGCGRNVAPSDAKQGNVTCSTCRRERKADGRKMRVPGTRKNTPPTRKAPAKTDYRPGIHGLSQLLCLPLSFTQPLDAWAIQQHTPPIAEALNNLAHARPEVAAVLDKLLAAGPYAEIGAAILPLAIQLATNHKVIPDPVATQLGAIPREALEAELRRRGEEMTEQAAA